MPFDLIPAGELAIDQPDFKASIWKRSRLNGTPCEYSQCYELIGGRWEGFVSVRGIARKGAPGPSKPRISSRPTLTIHEPTAAQR